MLGKSLIKIFLALGLTGIVFISLAFFIVYSGKAKPVDASTREACLHYDSQTIMSKVIRAKTHDEKLWHTFSDVQDAAQKAGILIDPANISLSGRIWMVPLTQRTSADGTKNFTGLLDCKTDSVEFSGG